MFLNHLYDVWMEIVGNELSKVINFSSWHHVGSGKLPNLQGTKMEIACHFILPIHCWFGSWRFD
jgi:hypothetical protein